MKAPRRGIQNGVGLCASRAVCGRAGHARGTYDCHTIVAIDIKAEGASRWDHDAGRNRACKNKSPAAGGPTAGRTACLGLGVDYGRAEGRRLRRAGGRVNSQNCGGQPAASRSLPLRGPQHALDAGDADISGATTGSCRLVRSGRGLVGMDQVRTPSDQTLALLDRAGRRRSRQYLNDRVLDRESVDELLRVRELLKLLKCADINCFLVQVWPEFGHRGQIEECDQRQNTNRAVYLKNQRYHLVPGLSSRAPNR